MATHGLVVATAPPDEGAVDFPALHWSDVDDSWHGAPRVNASGDLVPITLTWAPFASAGSTIAFYSVCASLEDVEGHAALSAPSDDLTGALAHLVPCGRNDVL